MQPHVSLFATVSAISAELMILANCVFLFPLLWYNTLIDDEKTSILGWIIISVILFGLAISWICIILKKIYFFCYEKSQCEWRKISKEEIKEDCDILNNENEKVLGQKEIFKETNYLEKIVTIQHKQRVKKPNRCERRLNMLEKRKKLHKRKLKVKSSSPKEEEIKIGEPSLFNQQNKNEIALSPDHTQVRLDYQIDSSSSNVISKNDNLETDCKIGNIRHKGAYIRKSFLKPKEDENL